MSRVAVVGGGAAGVATAWLLSTRHDVTLIEAAPVLGGHIRTLGANVVGPVLPAGLRLDAGVIEFDRHNFPAFHAWMALLEVEVRDLDGGGCSRLVRADGSHLLSPALVPREHAVLRERIEEYRQLLPLMLRRRRFFARTAVDEPHRLYGVAVGRFLDSSELSTWIRALLMYAYSTPFDETGKLSAAMAVPMLRQFLCPGSWTCIPGGVFTYVERALETMNVELLLQHPVAWIRREPLGVRLGLAGGEERPFDAVVLAVPPHLVLSLLDDASEAERRRFASWEGDTVETVVHDDVGLYRRHGIHVPTEFDLFERPSGDFGYNAYLNRLAGLPEGHARSYGLAFRLDDELDPARVIHRQQHVISLYRAEALCHRGEIERRNGEDRTYYAGAWLGDGLHEGAIRSALAVSARLGGRDEALTARIDRR